MPRVQTIAFYAACMELCLAFQAAIVLMIDLLKIVWTGEADTIGPYNTIPELVGLVWVCIFALAAAFGVVGSAYCHKKMLLAHICLMVTSTFLLVSGGGVMILYHLKGDCDTTKLDFGGTCSALQILPWVVAYAISSCLLAIGAVIGLYLLLTVTRRTERVEEISL